MFVVWHTLHHVFMLKMCHIIKFYYHNIFIMLPTATNLIWTQLTEHIIVCWQNFIHKQSTCCFLFGRKKIFVKKTNFFFSPCRWFWTTCLGGEGVYGSEQCGETLQGNVSGVSRGNLSVGIRCFNAVNEGQLIIFGNVSTCLLNTFYNI